MTAASLDQTGSLQRRLSRAERLDLPRRLTLGSAGLVVVVVALLLIFIVVNGLAIFYQNGVGLDRLASTVWQPASGPEIAAGSDYMFGVGVFVAGSLDIMVLAALVATPLAVGLALFMSEIAPDWVRSIIRPAMEVFVGIPSVVWGFLGATLLVPFLRGSLGFTLGYSLLAGGLVVGIMILPTITSVAYDAIRTVPADLRTASLGMGATRWQTLRHVVLPASLTGLATAIVLGMMRAAGEALAVQMVIGNNSGSMPVPDFSKLNGVADLPHTLFDPLARPMITLTSEIAMDLGNTTSGEPWRNVIWLMALILLVISLGFVIVVRRLSGGRQLG